MTSIEIESNRDMLPTRCGKMSSLKTQTKRWVYWISIERISIKWVYILFFIDFLRLNWATDSFHRFTFIHSILHTSHTPTFIWRCTLIAQTNAEIVIERNRLRCTLRLMYNLTVWCKSGSLKMRNFLTIYYSIETGLKYFIRFFLVMERHAGEWKECCQSRHRIHQLV